MADPSRTRPPIRAVVWDLGGVLVRTEDQGPRGAWEARLGLSPRQLSRLVFEGETGRRAMLGGADVDAVWSSVGRELDLSEADAQGLRHAFFAGDRLDEGLVAAIRRLRPRRRTALLSNAWPDLRDWVENVWKMADAFDEVVISSEEGVAKPDPEIYLRLLRRLGMPSPQVVLVDDTEANVLAAQALGLHTVRFESRDQCAAELSGLLGEPFPMAAPGATP